MVHGVLPVGYTQWQTGFLGHHRWLHVVVHLESDDVLKLIPRKIFIPFGTYLLIRSDVVHSGLCGSSGNLRFHMVFKNLSVCGHKLLYVDTLDINSYPSVDGINCKEVITITDPDRKFGEMVCTNAKMVRKEVIKEYLGNVDLS